MLWQSRVIVENHRCDEFLGEEGRGKGICHVKNTSSCLFGEHRKKSRNTNKGK